jgi:branched-chain amino acid aminotransferase
MSNNERSSNFTIHPSTHPATDEVRTARLAEPGFGRYFTDHIARLTYSHGEWSGGSVEAYAPISLDPVASVLHYGQAVFDGFKAYAQPDGGISVFRPLDNARRFQASARRLAMPELPVELFLESTELLVRQDRIWVPKNVGESLYLRPLMIATEPALGVRPSTDYLYLLIASPAGAYFPRGIKPLTVWISQDYVRASPGGTGAAKCAGNYAGSLAAQRQAQEMGCEQVIWLDAVERRYIEELGGMNIAFVFRRPDGGHTLVTPELTGTLLPGVTRMSLLTLAADLGLTVEERKIDLQEIDRTVANGTLAEVFACGTAAVITPVARMRGTEIDWQVGDGTPGRISMLLRESLLNIQHGRAPDTHGWMHKIL